MCSPRSTVRNSRCRSCCATWPPRAKASTATTIRRRRRSFAVLHGCLRLRRPTAMIPPPEREGIAVDAKQIAALADRIAEARRSRKVMDFLAADTATLSESDSYKVQFAVHDRLTGDGKDAMAG